jgi:succinylglutamate desuccinylase
MLSVLDTLPQGLLALDASHLYQVLPGPTLIHLPGRRREPLFISVLLHGNEYSGWEAVRTLLQKYQDVMLPRSLSIFVGNTEAARYGVRRLNAQPDYNRIWRGGGTPEHKMMSKVLAEMRERQVFASVDIHNNTGANPHYACVNVLESRFLHLAALFSRTVVYFTTPDTVQSRAFAELCPAVTVEVGQSGHRYGVDHALEYVDACLHLASLPEHPVASADLDLFHTVAIVRVPIDVSFGFDGGDTELRLVDDLDRLNFCELPTGTLFGWAQTHRNAWLEVWDESGAEVSERYFTVCNSEILTTRPVMPSMLTLDEQVIRQDCLCYLMERYHL